jgi:hypothetical protein
MHKRRDDGLCPKGSVDTPVTSDRDTTFNSLQDKPPVCLLVCVQGDVSMKHMQLGYVGPYPCMATGLPRYVPANLSASR